MSQPVHQTAELTGILAQLRQGAALPFERAHALPPDVYTSEGFLAAEIERIFATEWLCVGRVDDIPRTGDFVTTDIPGLPVVTLRGETGEILSLSNVCAHRGMRLLSGQGQCGRHIVCPYHAWTYGLDGHLASAPRLKQRADFAPAEHGLTAVRTDIWQGWIYVTANEALPPVARHVAELDAAIGRYRADRYQQILKEEMVWKTNWKILMENFMEDYHLPKVHKATISGYSPTNEVEVFEGRPTFSWHVNRKTPGAPRGLAHPSNTHLDGDWRRTTVLFALLPGHLVNLSPDHLWSLSLLPAGTDRVRIRFGLSYAPEVLADVADREAFIAEWKSFFDRVNAEDRGVVEGVRSVIGSRLAKPGPICDLERFTYDFGKYLLRKIGGESL
ncbi:MAG: aromatic ring-hydroxylating dioxygenase subunit alpha [Dongiaceae bacterium]